MEIHSITIKNGDKMYYCKNEDLELYTAYLANNPGVVVQANSIEDCEKEILICLGVINTYLNSINNDS